MPRLARNDAVPGRETSSVPRSMPLPWASIMQGNGPVARRQVQIALEPVRRPSGTPPRAPRSRQVPCSVRSTMPFGSGETSWRIPRCGARETRPSACACATRTEANSADASRAAMSSACAAGGPGSRTTTPRPPRRRGTFHADAARGQPERDAHGRGPPAVGEHLVRPSPAWRSSRCVPSASHRSARRGSSRSRSPSPSRLKPRIMMPSAVDENSARYGIGAQAPPARRGSCRPSSASAPARRCRGSSASPRP